LQLEKALLEDPDSLPKYVSQDLLANGIHNSNRKSVPQPDSEVFYRTDMANETYDAYEKDIAVAHFYFDSPTVMEFSRAPRMTIIDFISQVGGLMGLCLGFR
jgi:hypothetical protein